MNNTIKYIKHEIQICKYKNRSTSNHHHTLIFKGDINAQCGFLPQNIIIPGIKDVGRIISVLNFEI